jgi:hypothetical protein
MTRFAVSPDAAFATLDDGAVILNLRTKRYYSLNETGAAIWGMLDGGTTTVSELIGKLVDLYDVSDAEARRAVEQLLRDLEGEELVTREPV